MAYKIMAEQLTKREVRLTGTFDPSDATTQNRARELCAYLRRNAHRQLIETGAVAYARLAQLLGYDNPLEAVQAVLNRIGPHTEVILEAARHDYGGHKRAQLTLSHRAHAEIATCYGELQVLERVDAILNLLYESCIGDRYSKERYADFAHTSWGRLMEVLGINEGHHAFVEPIHAVALAILNGQPPPKQARQNKPAGRSRICVRLPLPRFFPRACFFLNPFIV